MVFVSSLSRFSSVFRFSCVCVCVCVVFFFFIDRYSIILHAVKAVAWKWAVARRENRDAPAPTSLFYIEQVRWVCLLFVAVLCFYFCDCVCVCFVGAEVDPTQTEE